ncbi:hypothetical protein SALBM135S_06083 [Streptomyces alboniger]
MRTTAAAPESVTNPTDSPGAPMTRRASELYVWSDGRKLVMSIDVPSWSFGSAAPSRFSPDAPWSRPTRAVGLPPVRVWLKTVTAPANGLSAPMVSPGAPTAK